MNRRGAILLLGAAALLETVLARMAPPALLLLLLPLAAAMRPRARPWLRTPFAVAQGILPALFLGALYLGLEPVRALVGLCGSLLLLRAPGPDTPYSDFLLFLFSLVVAFGSAAAAPGSLPAAITLLHVVALSFALAGMPVSRAGGAGAGPVPTERHSAAWRALPFAALLVVALLGVAAGTLLYLGAPRFAKSRGPLGPELSASVEGRRARVGYGSRERGLAGSGFPDEIELADAGAVRLDPRGALVADLRLRGRPYDPPPGQRQLLLLRLHSFDEYDAEGARWSRAEPAQWRPLDPSGLLEEGEVPLSYSIRLEGYDGVGVFLPPRARRILGQRVLVDGRGDARREGRAREYRADAAFPPAPAAGAPDRSDHRLLHVPRQAVRALLRRQPIPPGSDPPAAFAALRSHFSDFAYSAQLDESVRDAPDPLAAFLDRKVGHCELFASAACLFLRMAGIPARLAGGVRCAERVGAGVYRARFRNAHAWVEVPFAGVGFVPLDFTPVGGSSEAPGTGEAEEVAERGEGAAAGPVDWSRPFAYGREEQRRLAEWVKERLSWRPAALLLGLSAAALAGRALRRRSRGRPQDPLRVAAPAGGSRSSLLFYERWLRACAAAGHRRAPAETPREFVGRLPEPLAEAGRRVTADFERLRYG